jgi:hypothetical protein
MCPETWADKPDKPHQCPFSAKEEGLCGTHLRQKRMALGHKLDDRFRIRQLQSGYDELRRICNRLHTERTAYHQRATKAEALLRAAHSSVPDKALWEAIRSYLGDVPEVLIA